MWEQIIAGVIIVALIVIIILLAKISASFNRRDKNYQEVIGQAISHMSDEAFKRERKKIAKMTAEQDRVAKWIEKLGKEGKIDVSLLASEAEKRDFALALKKAEDYVTYSETVLDRIRHEITKTQKDIVNHARIPYSLEQDKKVLTTLLEQEEIAKKRAKNARKRLDILIAATSPEESGPSLVVLEDAPPPKTEPAGPNRPADSPGGTLLGDYTV